MKCGNLHKFCFEFRNSSTCLMRRFEACEKSFFSLCLLVSSADNLSKQFKDWTQIRTYILSVLTWIKLFDTLMVFLKEYFEKVDFEKNQLTTKFFEKLPSMKRFFCYWNISLNSGPPGYNTFSMLNSAEHENYPAHKW